MKLTDERYSMLLTHLYQYFGILLGCSGGTSPVKAYPAYEGFDGMYQVHKFMALDAYEVSYFIEQVGLSAASFGVATADVEAVGEALQKLFGYRCAPATQVIPKKPDELESICTDVCVLSCAARNYSLLILLHLCRAIVHCRQTLPVPRTRRLSSRRRPAERLERMGQCPPRRRMALAQVQALGPAQAQAQDLLCRARCRRPVLSVLGSPSLQSR